jgi:starch-binding outer membrane protein, SusD/RagB family
VAGCDLTVTNPGPVEDEFLNDPLAQHALVNGMGRNLADALNWISYTTGAVTREVHASGSTGSYGISPRQQIGLMQWDDLHIDAAWDNAQRARWVASDGIRRLEEVLEGAFGSSWTVARGHLWHGYANRLLGENMCEAVIDGGGIELRGRFFELAEQAFGDAIQVAAAALAAGGLDDDQVAHVEATRTAAHAGRASVRVHRDNWSGALEDAAMVPDGFTFRMPYHDIGDLVQANRIFHAAEGAPYRAHTAWNTVNEAYFQDTGDPRVRWLHQPGQEGDAAVADLGEGVCVGDTLNEEALAEFGYEECCDRVYREFNYVQPGYDCRYFLAIEGSTVIGVAFFCSP